MTAVADAGPSQDKRDAANRKLDRTVRIAACTRLIDNAELTKQEHAQAYLQRGTLLRRNEEWDQAMADFDQCLLLDPGNPSAHKNRGFVYFNTNRFTDADAAFSQAIELDPRNEVHFFYRARARAALKKYDEAIADYSQALVFAPRYFSAYTGRARVHYQNQDYEQAIADCDAALSLDPYVADAYFVRGLAQEELKRREKAIHDFSLALILDPNIDGPEEGLQRLQATTEPAEAGEPVKFLPPKEGITITYLQTRGKAEQTSEADEFTAELLGWFKKKRVPVPTRKLFVSRKIGASNEGITSVTAGRRDAEPGAAQKTSSFNYYRSLWPTVLPGPAGLSLDVRFDAKAMNSLWPLTPGKQLEGTGKLELVGPDPLPPQAVFLGCKKPGDRVPMGSTAWKGGAIEWENIVIPAGTFKTVKLTFEDSVELNLFGRKTEHTSVVTLWYAPSVRWWVKRERKGDGNWIIDAAETIE